MSTMSTIPTSASLLIKTNTRPQLMATSPDSLESNTSQQHKKQNVTKLPTEHGTKGKQIKTNKSSENTFACKYGTISKYGVKFDQNVAIESAKYQWINFSNAFGCSMHAKYCNGKIQSIPCCTKIMYDNWYAADKYLAQYNVTYSFHTGSLLMSVRDGRHAPWDSSDIDLAFLWPPTLADEAIEAFMNAYQLEMDGANHIMDWKQNFYKLHHKQYGFPEQQKKYCFYDQIGHADKRRDAKYIKNRLQLNELMDNEDALILGGTSCFVDFVIGGVGNSGMGDNAKHITFKQRMIEIEYKGSNGILPPRQIYIFPDFYKQLYSHYGDDWYKGYDTFLPNKYRKYFGLDASFDNTYFLYIYKKSLIKMRNLKVWREAKLSKNETEMLRKYKNLQLEFWGHREFE